MIVYLTVRSKYAVTDSFFAKRKKKSCVLDSWLGDHFASSFYSVGIVLVDRIFRFS